jgi:hypothetical protein
MHRQWNCHGEASQASLSHPLKNTVGASGWTIEWVTPGRGIDQGTANEFVQDTKFYTETVRGHFC